MTIEDPETTPALPPPRRAWGRSLTLGTVILLCGIAIGGIGTAVFMNRGGDHESHKFGRDPKSFAQKMKEDYRLSDKQAGQLEGMFREHWDRLSAIRAEVQPRVDSELEALKADVGKVLSPEQAKQWRADFERRQQNWKSRFGRSSAADAPSTLPKEK